MPTDKILKFKRGNTTKNNAYTGSDGELTVDRTKKTLVVHDGINAGGSPLATEESVNNVIQELENKVDINENITTQGNLFNGLDQLVKLDSSGKLPAIDGSQLTGVSSGSLVDSGVNAGTYKSVTVNSKGIITAGTNPTTLLGYGITDADTSAQVTTKVNNAVAALVDSTPTTLDTLNELAAALGDDPNFAATTSTALGNRVVKNADIVAGTGTKITYDAKGLVTGSSIPTTLAGYGITDAATSDHNHSDATTSVSGFMSTADKSKLAGIAASANNYSLPIASASVLGGVKAGANITIDAAGVISASASGGTPATETSAGLIELATTAEAQARTDDSRAITPLKLFNSLKGSNQNLSASGYQKLHGGLIIQWGTYSGVLGHTSSYTPIFPIAFPNACVKVLTQYGNTTVSTNSGPGYAKIEARGNSSFTFQWGWYSGGSAQVDVDYIAIGY